MKESLLEVQDLDVHFKTEEGIVSSVKGVSFSVKKGETLAIVGESGCGKSVTSLSVMRLISPPGRITGGKILFNGQNHYCCIKLGNYLIEYSVIHISSNRAKKTNTA